MDAESWWLIIICFCGFEVLEDDARAGSATSLLIVVFDEAHQLPDTAIDVFSALHQLPTHRKPARDAFDRYCSRGRFRAIRRSRRWCSIKRHATCVLLFGEDFGRMPGAVHWMRGLSGCVYQNPGGSWGAGKSAESQSAPGENRISSDRADEIAQN
jgi:hypothetical protein